MVITEEPIQRYREIASIPIAFEVDRVLVVRGSELVEQPVAKPWVKDYDAIPGNRPEGIEARFDVSNWGLLFARFGERLAGAAAIAVDLPEQRGDVAVLWDLRVSPDDRRRGIGAALFAAAEQWARSRRFRRLEVETQNSNVGACRFYARQGCALSSVNRTAYPELPDEVQLMWGRDL